MDVIRDRGVMARLGEDGRVQNLYRVQLMNKRETPSSYRIGAAGLDGLTVDEPQVWTLQPGEVRSYTVRLSLPAEASGPQEIELGVDRKHPRWPKEPTGSFTAGLWALGFALVHLISALLASDQFYFPVVIQPRTYAWAAVCVLAAGVVSALIVRRRIDRLDMVAVLKTRE